MFPLAPSTRPAGIENASTAFFERKKGESGALVMGRNMFGGGPGPWSDEPWRGWWGEDQPEWDELDHEFAALWRAHPKWVVSRTLKSVGPSATLVSEDIEEFVRRLKAEVEGTIDVYGPELAGSLSKVGLIDEYHLYYRPFVLGAGKPFFAAPLPALRLVETTMVGEDAAKLILVPT